MNAQEAIEKTQNKKDMLTEIKDGMVADLMESELTHGKVEYELTVNHINNIEQEIEALSIILESAKKLHEDSLMRKFKDDNGAPRIHILHGKSYDEAEAETIGLEVEQ